MRWWERKFGPFLIEYRPYDNLEALEQEGVVLQVGIYGNYITLVPGRFKVIWVEWPGHSIILGKALTKTAE